MSWRSAFGIAEPSIRADRPSNSGGSSSSGSSGATALAEQPGTVTRTSGMSTTGWHSYDEGTARRHHREAQVSLPAAETDGRGGRKLSPKPDPSDTNRSFWRSR